METIRVQQIVAKDGEVLISGTPYKKGQAVEIIVSPLSVTSKFRSRLNVRQLRQSGLIGLWKDRDDIQDSKTYARQLREQAQKRGDIDYDFDR